ncbi:MAG TPA: hypothetical protein VEZ90_08520, partial [Blastocatellia bacterium]|nr:hypothetical protein [Blastocatellia bacterium]
QCAVFDTCVQDDTSGNVLMWSSTTGAYQYIVCGPTGSSMTGKGTVGLVNSIRTLTDSRSDRRMTATYNTAQKTGRATITLIPAPGISQSITLSRTNPNATCVCH